MRRRTILLVVLVVLFAAVMLAPFALITVPPGHLGVLWLRFFGGTVKGSGLGEGLQPIFPWDRVYGYDGRLQARNETYDVVSKDGLREVIARYDWQALVSSQRQEVQQKILNDAAGQDPTTGRAVNRFLVPLPALRTPRIGWGHSSTSP